MLNKNISFNVNKNNNYSSLHNANKKIDNKNVTEELENCNFGYFSSNETNNIFIPMIADSHSSRNFNNELEPIFKGLNNKNTKNNLLKMNLRNNCTIEEKNGASDFYWGVEKIIPKLHKIKIEKGMETNSKFVGNLNKKISNMNYQNHLSNFKKYKLINMINSLNNSNENIGMINKNRFRSNSCNRKINN